MEIEIEDNEFELDRLTGNETEQHKGRNCCRIVNSKQIREKKEQCSAIYQTCCFSPKHRQCMAMLEVEMLSLIERKNCGEQVKHMKNLLFSLINT